MIQHQFLPGYKLIEIEAANDSDFFYKAYSSELNKLVLIKAAKNRELTASEAASYIHDFHLSDSIQSNAVLKPIKMIHHLQDHYFVYEYVEGVTLEGFLRKQYPLSINDSLKIAKNLATAISQIHQKQVIHKNINPAHLFIMPQTFTIKVTGFNHATFLKQENHLATTRPHAIDGDLSYISPEQTGRMNQTLDFRTDLYSLGVTFYRLFTGTLPFMSKDPVQLVYAHLAMTPQVPWELRKELPETISAIIIKLLSKSPEARYNSAWGVREDLVKALSQLEAFGSIESFPLGQNDNKTIFETARKLYGRDSELHQIQSIFSKVCHGDLGFVLIPGRSGIGKTALVNEIHKPLVKEKGYFISGKFNQMQRQVPFAPIIAAFQSLIRQIMTEDAEQIEQWKNVLQRELTVNTAVITGIIPELKWLLGDQDLAQDGSSADSQKRFLFIFQKFVNVFATKMHPLVLFLDDMQWADIASLEMIEYLLSQTNCQYLMVIAAYRDNEVGPNHPFVSTMKKIKDTNVSIEEIPLHNLPKDTVHKWLQDSFRNRSNGIEKLSLLMHRITQGNPFHVKQLLQSYYEDGHIISQPIQGSWIPSLKQIAGKPVEGDIIQFLTERISLLPEPTQDMLKLASCIGNRFDLQTLAIISEKTYKEAADDLWTALDAGLILPNDMLYKWIYPDEEKRFLESEPPVYTFLHDRVQQAVYSTMTKNEQEQAHLTIGRLLVKFTNNLEDNLFTIVNHLNVSSPHLNKEEVIQLTEWNIRAGEKAQASAAFSEALKYFQNAYLLAGENWREQYELTIRMMKGIGECQYVTSSFKESEATINHILEYAQSQSDKLDLYQMKMTLYTHVHRVEEAVDAGIKGLKQYGIHLSRNPGKLAILKELALVKKTLYGKTKEDLLNLPKMTDPTKRQILQTMINMNGPTFHADQDLATLLMLRAIRFTLKHGLADISALVFNNYALILSAGFNDFKGSYEFGNLAVELSERFDVIGIKGRIQFVYGSFVNHWAHPISKSLEYFEKSQAYCLDAGNIHLAGANVSFIVIASFIKGTPINEALEGVESQMQFVHQIQYQISTGFLEEMHQWLHFLNGTSPHHSWEFETVLDDDSAKIIHYTIRLQMAYLFNKAEYAKYLLDQLDQLINDRLTLIIVPEYYFYHALWLARFYPEANSAFEKKMILKRLRKRLKKLRKWAKLAPDNYLHKYLLIMAELARIEENQTAALRFYQDAIESAEQHGYIQDSALGNECAAYYFATIGYTKLAKAFFSEAYKLYVKWGATNKAEQLLLEQNLINPTNQIPNLARRHQDSQSFFDVNTALEATQSLSKEIIVEALLNKLMDITMQYGGADRGFLLYKEDTELLIVEQKSLDKGKQELVRNQPVIGSGLLAENVVYYVETSKEAVVLDDAATEGMFTEDPYIATKRLKSLLCLPIIIKGMVSGVLYLENNKATYAFTEGEVKLLTFLATQAAISIENAYLYEKLESKVSKRTIELNEANRYLEELNQRLEKDKQSRRHFLSNISHDLRAPISSVKGYLEAILDGVVQTDGQRMQYLKNSLDRIHNLNLLIHDLFELSQLESGQIPFSLDFIPLDKFMDHLYQKYETDTVSHGLNFRLDNQLAEADTLSMMVELDSDRIEQVFTNLINNALNHTREGEIILSLAKARDSQHIIISVQDTGSGIPTEELPFIFDRNFTKARKYSVTKGHGLGLSICKEIITFHKGEIWAESEEGMGSTFFIRLPVFQYVDNWV
ncbi:ATP-binding sensor histidine kinase [Peribacillus loiseleuriae]|uniref:histidine kinase n=1 Tax=Peribacillus loiseleuriae TaxID=1679170 RepID=A0A0K9GY74_9BACI|nr:ATP-binding sensor histidine kinase [Peribacillus loiseleuriae]KMY51570.1 hypothetical protein AC625_20150 [Peribacillus loiseleuriae]